MITLYINILCDNIKVLKKLPFSDDLLIEEQIYKEEEKNT